MPPAEPTKPAYDAFTQPEDPPGLKLCRPCRDNAGVGPVHGCDGPPCQCLICADVAPTVTEMEADWNMRDREDSWRL